MNQLTIPLFRLKLVREAERTLDSNRITCTQDAVDIITPIVADSPNEVFGGVEPPIPNPMTNREAVSLMSFVS